MKNIRFMTWGEGDSPAPDVKVNIANPQQALDAVIERAVNRHGFMLFTINLDHLVKMQVDRRFRAIYATADFITADGWPIVRLLSHEGCALQRTTGADLLEPVIARSAACGLSTYFIGPGVESQTLGLRVLAQRYPGLDIAGAELPQLRLDFDAEDAQALAERVKASGARLCILSLGAPKQELLAAALREKCPEVGFLCVGAALDFISGRVARAPLWMQRCGLEWLWRMANDPKRLTGRYAVCLMLFFKLLVRRAQHRDVGFGLSEAGSS